MKLTAEQRIERTHVTLMRHKDFCLFSGMFMIGKVEVVDKRMTASTNGRDVIYGRKFVDILDDKMLAFLVVHEAMHKGVSPHDNVEEVGKGKHAANQHGG
jgi:hypothetical protein